MACFARCANPPHESEATHSCAGDSEEREPFARCDVCLRRVLLQVTAPLLLTAPGGSRSSVPPALSLRALQQPTPASLASAWGLLESAGCERLRVHNRAAASVLSAHPCALQARGTRVRRSC